MMPLQAALPNMQGAIPNMLPATGILRTSSLGNASPAWMPQQSSSYPSAMPPQPPPYASAMHPSKVIIYIYVCVSVRMSGSCEIAEKVETTVGLLDNLDCSKASVT